MTFENSTALDVDFQALNTELTSLGAVCHVPDPPLPTFAPVSADLLGTEYWPSLTWFRPDYEPIDHKKANNLERYPKLQGLLGFMPKSIRSDLRAMGHDEELLTTANMDAISAIIRDTTLTSFLRSERWKRRKKQ